MWCARCQADVAAEVSAETQAIQCVQCGSRLTAGREDRPSKDPHELLARWSETKFLDPFESLPKPRKEPVPQEPPPPRRTASPTSEQAPKSRQVHTFHSAHGMEPHVRGRGTGTRRGAAPTISTRRVDPPWEVPGPHFSAKMIKPEKGAHWLSFWGQVCAYGGVALLTGGTAMVLVGYFGGPPDYAPTGWLVNTVGQMLLFLGVITLVSGGLEQTTYDVTSRVDTLGNRLVRLEYLLQREDTLVAHDEGSAETHYDDQ